MPATRVVAGISCTWWDTIDQAATKTGSGLPCCPGCGSVLFEWPDEDAFMEAVTVGGLGHEELVRFTRGRCFATPDAALRTMEEERRIRAATDDLAAHAARVSQATSPVGRFRKKPVEVEARQVPPTPDRDLELWLGDAFETWLPKTGQVAFRIAKNYHQEAVVGVGDWIIAEPDGEGFYPCVAAEFERVYEPVEEQP